MPSRDWRLPSPAGIDVIPLLVIRNGPDHLQHSTIPVANAAPIRIEYRAVSGIDRARRSTRISRRAGYGRGRDTQGPQLDAPESVPGHESGENCGSAPRPARVEEQPRSGRGGSRITSHDPRA